MAATLRILDEALDFGTVTAGAASEPRALRVRNDGDAEAFFVRVRAVAHLEAQVGAAADTYGAMEFALGEKGTYARELDLGALAPGEERTVWARWSVPREAPAGAVVWAVEAIGSTT